MVNFILLLNADSIAQIVVTLLRWLGTRLARSRHSFLAALIFGVADDISPTIRSQEFEHALALWQEGRYNHAKLTLEQILIIKPEHPEANNLLGAIYFEDDDSKKAHISFTQAIRLKQEWAAPYNNLGNIYRNDQQYEEAEFYYRQALDKDPTYVEALTNLGAVLDIRGESLAAEVFCRKAIECAPNFGGAHCNLGNALLSLHRGGEAVAAYREALRLQPGIPEALVNLALILEDNSYLLDTIKHYENLIARQPRNYLPHLRIAQALQALRCWDEARSFLKRTITLKPEDFEALFLLAVNYINIGDVNSSINCLRRILLFTRNNAAQVLSIFNSMYLADYSGEYLCSEYRNWAESYINRKETPAPPILRKETSRRLRIGYVSRDFAKHSVAYFIEPILQHHERTLFEVFCYSTLIKPDTYTDRFISLADNWRDISTLSEDKVVNLIKHDEIDLLIDLSGHTTGNRLGVFARKPAPVQVTYLGHPSTTGLTAIDYRIGDAITDPIESTANHYVERIWHLPGCFLTYNPPSVAPTVVSPPVLEKGHITFGSCNNIAKLNNSVISTWAEILKLVPSSRLLLKGFAFASARGRERITDLFRQSGIAPARIELVDWRADLQSHLDLYSEIDISLDPFPYNGTTTSCEAMWMGVPVICLEGERHSARVGASLLTSLGMESFIAKDIQSYVQIAGTLASDIDRLVALRSTFRAIMEKSSLLDHAGFTSRLEQAYRDMWRIYCGTQTRSSR